MSNILVVDDDVDILTLLEMTLKIHDFKVDIVSRWQFIDEHIKNFAPDLILLDISLLDADGREICKRLKQSEETKNIAIVLFSANPELGTNYKAYLADDFIAKPFELSLLLRTIREQLN